MSRHLARSERWAPQGADRFRSLEGLVVYRFKGEWWAEVSYALKADDGGAEAWEPRQDKLGPSRRPRNAMIDAERHAVMLRNRHGDRIRLGAE